MHLLLPVLQIYPPIRVLFCPHPPHDNIISIIFCHDYNCNPCNPITDGYNMQHTGELLALDTGSLYCMCTLSKYRHLGHGNCI